MAVTKKKPEIRFQGFIGKWEEKRLGEVFSFKQGLQCDLKKQRNNPANGLVQFIRIIDLTTDDEPPRYIDEPDKTYHIEKQDLFMVRYGSPGLLGFGYEGVIANNLFSLNPLFNINKLYFYTLLSYKNNEIQSLCSSTTMDALSFSSLDKLKITFSTSNNEQTRIGSFFQNLDNLTAQHQKKYDKLKNIKKAMLEKMFPQAGEDEPEIRFKGFSKKWEEKKLGEIADKAVDNRGKTPPLSNNGTHPMIEVISLGKGYPDYSKIDKYIDEFTYHNFLRDYLKEGDILFSTVGSIGQVSLMDANENAVIAQNIVAFRSKEFYSPYLYAMFSTAGNKIKALRIVMGAVQPSIKVSQLIELNYLITNNKNEQIKIGDFFLNIDKLINLNQQEIEKLKNIKKSMLEKMFV